MDEKVKRTNRVAVWSVVAVVFVVVAGSAGVGLWLRSQPPPLTGDYAADRACAAAMTTLIDDQGRPTVARFMMMDDVTRTGWVSGVVAESQYSELPDIVWAGEQLAFSTQVESGSVLGIGMFTKAFVALSEACRSHGWTACAAGLIAVGCVATLPK